jgi:hypothetical protein
MGRLCVHVFIEVSAHIYISICVYIVFLKKDTYVTLSFQRHS